jgi:hypothetical protein
LENAPPKQEPAKQGQSSVGRIESITDWLPYFVMSPPSGQRWSAEHKDWERDDILIVCILLRIIKGIMWPSVQQFKIK